MIQIKPGRGSGPMRRRSARRRGLQYRRHGSGAARAVALGAPEIYAVTLDESETDITVTIAAETADISPIGVYAAVAPGVLTAKVTMMKEPQ